MPRFYSENQVREIIRRCIDSIPGSYFHPELYDPDIEAKNAALEEFDKINEFESLNDFK